MLGPGRQPIHIDREYRQFVVAKKQPIPISMLGFDARSLKSFEVFFASKCNGDFVIDEYCDATPLAFVDIDAVKGKAIVDELRAKFPEQVILAISILDHDDGDARTIQIKKPLNYQDFQQQLSTIKKAIVNNNFASLAPKAARPVKQPKTAARAMPRKPSAAAGVAAKTTRNKKAVSHSTAAASLMTLADDLHFVGDNSDIDLDDQRALQRITYSPAKRFQGALVKAVNQARKSGKPIELICLNTGVIVDPGKNTIITALKDNLLRPLCMLNIDKIDSLTELPIDYKGERILNLDGNTSKELLHWPIEDFIWKVTLWSSRGCIPTGTDVNAPVFLFEWPNFTRLVNFPHAMRIAALLNQHAVMLGDIARHLNIQQRYVFAFYSAAKVLGIVRISQRKIDQTMVSEPAKKDVAPRSLLTKLLGRLVGAPGAGVGVSSS